jgi:very-short-patch-repair endonuclease
MPRPGSLIVATPCRKSTWNLLYCHAAGLVVEVDGPIHEANVEYDRERDAVIAARGLKILRFRNDQIRHNLREVLAAITLARQQST